MSALVEGSWDDARVIAATTFKRLPSESVALNKSLGRTLAVDASALCDLPTYATSAMDGYAVCGQAPWKIIGEVKAGLPMKDGLKEGTAVGIATGAVIPVNTFGVIRWETAHVNGDILDGNVVADQDIRPAAHECTIGDVLINAGTTLNPAMIGLLAAAGLDTVQVFTKPKVALVLLGDEIQLTGIPSEGLVRDALGPQLPGWLEKLGCEIISTHYISDELELVVESLQKACTTADIIITTGGTAQGPRDYLHSALARLNADIVVDTVAVRPGHPMLLADIGGHALLGLPGNPQSAIVALVSLGQPVIDSMLGKPVRELPMVKTHDELTAPPEFTRLIIGNVHDGEFFVAPYLGSAMLRGLAQSTGFAVVTTRLTSPGESVRWLSLP